ncbi:MAG: chalcone isomerase family protein [Deltaproteobacteria bacterium]|nr:chalcone isomerase family protein [Deltaproteobacteria bacterium]
MNLFKSFVFFLIILFTSPVLAAELAGVTLPDQLKVDEQILQLNGLGLRKKAFIKVYVAGLYLPEKEASAKKILSKDQSRYVVMHFVRDVGKDKVCDAWLEGLNNNTAHPSDDLKAKMKTLCDYMEDIQKDQTYVFVYRPGKGTEVLVKGQSKGFIQGKDFADALLACLIGPNPPGEAFKAGLLGNLD